MNKVEGKLSFEASLPPLFTLERVGEVVGGVQQAHWVAPTLPSSKEQEKRSDPGPK